MQAILVPHPDSPPGPLERLAVEVERSEDGLKLVYKAIGDLDRVLLPRPMDEGSSGAGELWKHTCFEAFLQPMGEEGYLEFNFATSMQWASYRFDGYRQGMRPANVRPWVWECALPPGGLELLVEVTTGRFARPDIPAPVWRLGLSAVIEDIDGAMTYWALAHPSDKPDFHHPDSFTLELPAPETP